MNTARAGKLGILFVVIVAAAGLGRAAADVRYVDASAMGAADGSSWADAFVDLQAALAAALPGDELWVAAGVYTPGPPGDALSSFQLREGVGLYGGFSGVETSRAQRDWAANETVLSGDVGGDDTFDSPGGWPDNYRLHTANSGHVVVGSGVGASAVLDGFTVTLGAYGPAGTPSGDPLLYGSGLYAVAGSPTISHCRFVRNLGAFGPGGAIYLRDAGATIADCEFEQNYVHLGSGGAIYLAGTSDVEISDCVFRANVVTGYNGSEGQGGAIENRSSLPFVLARCRFEYNEARPFSAGAYERPRGGAVSSFGFETPAVIRECTFRYNRAAYGGAVFTWNPMTVLNCAFDHNTAFVYPGQGGISVGGDGGGIAAQWTDLRLLNCTVTRNFGQEAAGVVEFSDPNSTLFSGSVTVLNSIVWSNVASGQDVDPLDRQIRGDLTAEHSCIEDLLTPIPGEDPPNPAHFPGCVVTDPALVSPDGGDLHLGAGSPCIDAGRNSFVPGDAVTDLDGLSRFFDDPDAPDTGVGTPPLVDMGCLERQPAPPACPADLNGDGVVDLSDLATLLANFGAAGGATHADGDVDGDGDVDLADLAALLARFGEVCA